MFCFFNLSKQKLGEMHFKIETYSLDEHDEKIKNIISGLEDAEMCLVRLGDFNIA